MTDKRKGLPVIDLVRGRQLLSEMPNAEFFYAVRGTQGRDVLELNFVRPLNLGVESIEQILSGIKSIDKINPAEYMVVYGVDGTGWNGYNARDKQWVFLDNQPTSDAAIRKYIKLQLSHGIN